VRNTFPLTEPGAETDHPPAPKDAPAEFAPGVSVIVESGTFRSYSVPLDVKAIVWWVTCRVIGAEPIPETFPTLENQM
jgi:hypothetical protein